MIYLKGHLKPEPRLRRYAREHGDSSFCTLLDAQQGFQRPQPEGFTCAHASAIVLAMRNVLPHTDPWMPDCEPPEVRRSLFWVVDTVRPSSTATGNVTLQVGSAFAVLQAWDWVVFDDTILHSVQSDHKWRGIAWQLLPR